MISKNKAGFIALLLSITSLAQAQKEFIPGMLEEIVCHEERNASGHFLKIQNAPTDNYDLKYHRLEWTIDPDTIFISGKITSYFEMLQTGNKISFDLSDSLTVYSVLYQFTEIPFSHLEGNVLEINFPDFISAGMLDSVSVFYEGSPDSSGFGSFERTPMQSGFCIWTLSEPYGSRDWWPCKQTIADKIDSVDIHITCPVGYLAGTAGILIQSDTVGNWVTHHWKHRYPITTYLIGIAIAPYMELSHLIPLSTGTLPMVNYVFPENIYNAQIDEPNIVPIMQFYDSLFVAYPFMNEKYGHMQFGWPGGMEHQTMSSMYNYGYELMAHELAHQWFGDMITCRHWHDIWLNEGFATYLSGLCYEYFAPDIYWKPWKQQQVISVTSEPGGSVFVDDTTSVSRIFSGRLTYRKGGYLLHMIRGIIGDESFFQALRNYLNDPLLKYGFATTFQLKAHLEQTSGIDLDEFFDDWFYGQGYPSYQLRWNHDESNEVHLKLFQSTSMPSSIDFFEMPVTIRFKNESDSADILINPAFSGQSLSVTLPFIADTALIDPDVWIISAENSSIKVQSAEGEFYPIDIFPNPVRDVLYIYNFDLSPHSGTFELIDIAGRIVSSFNFGLEAGEERHALNVQWLGSGTYFFKFFSKELSYTIKLVKL